MKITLITATYNSAATLEDTFRSVLCQTHKDIDYIVVDGCSQDATLDIIQKYEPLFEGRMRWISEKDNGIYDAMNKGIAMAKGEVVGILNSDDFFTSNDILELVAKCMDDVDAVYGDIHFVDTNDLSRCIRYYSSRLFSPKFLRFGFMPAHPSFYVRKDVYDKYGVFSLNYKIASDYELMVRLLYVNKIRTRYLQKDFVTMRTGGISTRSMRNRWLITKEDVKACRSNGIYTNTLMVSCKYFAKVFEYKLFH